MPEVIKPRILVKASFIRTNLGLRLRFFANCRLHLEIMLQDSFKNAVSYSLLVLCGMEEIAKFCFFPNEGMPQLMKRFPNRQVIRRHGTDNEVSADVLVSIEGKTAGLISKEISSDQNPSLQIGATRSRKMTHVGLHKSYDFRPVNFGANPSSRLCDR